MPPLKTGNKLLSATLDAGPANPRRQSRIQPLSGYSGSLAGCVSARPEIPHSQIGVLLHLRPLDDVETFCVSALRTKKTRRAICERSQNLPTAISSHRLYAVPGMPTATSR